MGIADPLFEAVPTLNQVEREAIERFLEDQRAESLADVAQNPDVLQECLDVIKPTLVKSKVASFFRRHGDAACERAPGPLDVAHPQGQADVQFLAQTQVQLQVQVQVQAAVACTFCVRDGCNKPSWNGQPNEFCSSICKKCCVRPGCNKPSWNGQPNEFCSTLCKSSMRPGSVQLSQAQAESKTDFDWVASLALMRDEPRVGMNDAINSLSSLNKVSPDSKQLDMHKLRRIVAEKREEWQKSAFLTLCGLSGDMMDLCLALHVNTLQDPAVFHRVSEVSNAPDRSAKPNSQFIHCMPYLKMLDCAIELLPETFAIRATGYRGMKFKFPHLKEHFFRGREIYWYHPKSVTTNPDLMDDDEFAGRRGQRTIFIINIFNGKSIKRFSAYPEEEEVLTRVCQRFRVLDVKEQCSGNASYGDPLKTADLVYLDMLPDALPQVNLADSLIKAANAAIFENIGGVLATNAQEAFLEDLQKFARSNNETLLPSFMMKRGFPAPVCFAGPCKAGKSTLINALFGRVIVPASMVPNTAVPLHFHGSSRDPADPHYSITINGAGLKRLIEEALPGVALAYPDARAEGVAESVCPQLFHSMHADEGLTIGGLDAESAAAALDLMNSAVRRAVLDLANLNEQPMDEIPFWSFTVSVPGFDRGFAMIDLPGGSEGGTMGTIVQKTVSHQVKAACTVVIVVAGDNLTPLEHPQQIASFFGGEVPKDKPVLLVINKVERQTEKADIHDYLCRHSVQENLGVFPSRPSRHDAGSALYTNAKAMLSWTIASKFQTVSVSNHAASHSDAELAELKWLFDWWFPDSTFEDSYANRRVYLNMICDKFNAGGLDNALFPDVLQETMAAWHIMLAHRRLKGLHVSTMLLLQRLRQRMQNAAKSVGDAQGKISPVRAQKQSLQAFQLSLLSAVQIRHKVVLAEARKAISSIKRSDWPEEDGSTSRYHVWELLKQYDAQLADAYWRNTTHAWNEPHQWDFPRYGMEAAFASAFCEVVQRKAFDALPVQAVRSDAEALLLPELSANLPDPGDFLLYQCGPAPLVSRYEVTPHQGLAVGLFVGLFGTLNTFCVMSKGGGAEEMRKFLGEGEDFLAGRAARVVEEVAAKCVAHFCAVFETNLGQYEQDLQAVVDGFARNADEAQREADSARHAALRLQELVEKAEKALEGARLRR